MARQANKPGSGSSSPKRRASVRRKKKQGADRSVLIGGLLVAVLLLLVVLSVFSIKSDKDAPKQAASPKKETVIKKEAAAAAAPKPEKPEGQAAQTADNAPHEDISALIRLVLFDYEISRSSVDERVSSTAGGKTIYYFSVKSHADTASGVKEALRSVLSKKGYKVKSSGDKIIASGKRDSVQVAFVSSDGEDAAAKTGTPKKTAENKQAQARTAAKTGDRPTPPAPSDRVVKMAILLDDGGNSYELAERFAKSKFPLAIAILPHLEHSKEAARVSSAYGKTIFLHFPMQPKSYPSTDPGKGAVLLSMPEILIDGVAKENFESLGVPVDGFNNHMGSAVTEDPVKMAQVLKAAKNYTDTFVDSRTTAKSVAYDECVKAGMRCGINKKFIDNDNDVNLILERIYEAAELAKKNGEVLVIGHIRQKTLDALDIALPILESRRIAIVPIKTMVR